MPVDLTKPLSWKSANVDETTMLAELQANVLSGHVRDHLSVMFFSFSNNADARAFLQALVPLVKSALTHLQEIEVFKATNKAVKGSVYVGVGLTATGYKAIGVPAAKVPADVAFRKGMKARKTILADPASTTWDSAYQGRVDAVVLVGDENRASVNAARAQVLAVKPASVTLVGEEQGLSQVNSHGVGIEHFGYMDGRSQPLFLTEQIAVEPKTKWDPKFPLSQAITADPAAPPAVGLAPQPKFFGSYLVFRKLEQNVRAFKQAEEDLADTLGLVGEDREMAGAMVVGRFEDGTPIVTQPVDGQTPAAPQNDFNYDADKAGGRCPLHSHTRQDEPSRHGRVRARRCRTWPSDGTPRPERTEPGPTTPPTRPCRSANDQHGASVCCSWRSTRTSRTSSSSPSRTGPTSRGSPSRCRPSQRDSNPASTR